MRLGNAFIGTVVACVLCQNVRLASTLPPWSWDTIQTYIHCANMSGPWVSD